MPAMNHDLAASGALQRMGTQTDILGESPVWDERAQCLYWVDIRRPRDPSAQSGQRRRRQLAHARPRGLDRTDR